MFWSKINSNYVLDAISFPCSLFSSNKSNILTIGWLRTKWMSCQWEWEMIKLLLLQILDEQIMRFRNWWLHVLFCLNIFDQTTAFYDILGAHFGSLSRLVIFIYSNIFILYCYSLCELSMYRVEIPCKERAILT